MSSRWSYCLALFLCASAVCRADVTLHYTLDFKVSDSAPAAVTAPMKQQLSTLIPSSQTLRLKGTKTLSVIGPLTGIVDTADSTITLLNPATKQFAKMSMTDYLGSLKSTMAMPANAQQVLAGMNFDVSSSDTGQAAMVAGIRATDHLFTVSISMNLPGTPTPAGPMVRVDMHMWRASPDDLGRIPALREYSSSVERAMTVFNPADAMQQMFSQLPGFGDKFAAAMQNMSKDSGNLMVKLQESFYMPILAQLAPGSDSKLPMMEMNMVLADISQAALDDALFQVPSDFQAVSAAEMIKSIRPAVPTAPKASAPAAAAVAPLAAGESIYRVGGGVAAPSVIFKKDPEYTEEARKAKWSGSVLLSLVVDKEGLARNIQVVHSLGLGLDEKAIEAVQQWKFKPGTKAGEPVNVVATIEINFKLLDDPLKQQ